jgi:hypothetical protein
MSKPYADNSREDNWGVCSLKQRFGVPSTSGWSLEKPRAMKFSVRVLPLGGVLIHRALVKAQISRGLEAGISG